MPLKFNALSKVRGDNCPDVNDPRLPLRFGFALRTSVSSFDSGVMSVTTTFGALFRLGEL